MKLKKNIFKHIYTWKIFFRFKFIFKKFKIMSNAIWEEKKEEIYSSSSISK